MNPIKGEVPLKLSDGRELILVLDMEALVQAESAYGKPLPQMMADAAAGFVGAIRAMLYGALRTRHPDLSLRDASAMLAADAAAVAGALEQAAEAAMPEGKDTANPPEAGPLPSPHGKRSGRSGAKPA